MPDPIVFLHVPKTGGNSLGNMLAASVGEDRLCPRHGVLQLRELGAEEWRRYDLFSGHFDYSEVLRSPVPVRIVTMLRDPVERLLSLYRFWHSFSLDDAERDELAGPISTHALGLERFFTEAPLGIRSNYDNSTTRQIVGYEYSRPDLSFTLPEDEIVEPAKRRVDGFVACGITERFAPSVRRIFAALDLTAPDLRHDNRTVPQSEDERLTVASLAETAPALLRRLHDLTRLDRQLYAHACERLDQSAA